MVSDFEYCVIGAGVIGSAASYLLARGNNSVVCFEQFELGHEKGSSHGESRITRYSYDHPFYVEMAKRAYALWDEVIADSGEKGLFLKTGGIDLDENGGQKLSALISSLEHCKVGFETLDAAELRKRFPQFRIADHTKGLYQSEAGILNASLCVKVLQNLAVKQGAVINANTAVVKIEFEKKSVTISTPDAKFKAKKLILCAGAWMGPMLRGMGLNLPLNVTQEQYAFFEPLKSSEFEPGKFPVFIHYGGVGSGGIGWYGFPIFGRAGVKSSVHHTGKTVTADRRDFNADQAKLDDLHKRMQDLLPDAAGKIIHTASCLYTNSPDTHFIIDHLPGRDNAVFFTACSGHSFKFAAVIAEILIDKLNNRQPIVPMDLFSRKRFASLTV